MRDCGLIGFVAFIAFRVPGFKPGLLVALRVSLIIYL
jgi:hypothetical protein